jgi:hypothetical protein
MSEEHNMRITIKAAVLAATLALAASPAQALPPQAPSNDGTQHAPAGAPSNHGIPGPKASLPEKAKAYGHYCQSFSKKHVAGTPGTPFSRCVTDMAKLATNRSRSPRKACADQSRKHVRGEKGTAFSRCVAAGAKLLRAQTDRDS